MKSVTYCLYIHVLAAIVIVSYRSLRGESKRVLSAIEYKKQMEPFCNSPPDTVIQTLFDYSQNKLLKDMVSLVRIVTDCKGRI